MCQEIYDEKIESFGGETNGHVITVDYMKVITAYEISPMKEPPFALADWASEEEYRAYLEDVQPLIKEYETQGKIHDLVYETFEDIDRNRNEQHKINQFKWSFLNSAEWINVEKTMEGTYKVVTNGRHRMYVAKKYFLNLIVHVTQEEVGQRIGK